MKRRRWAYVMRWHVQGRRPQTVRFGLGSTGLVNRWEVGQVVPLHDWRRRHVGQAVIVERWQVA